jgi:two-component system, NtrC family, sensor kinase
LFSKIAILKRQLGTRNRRKRRKVNTSQQLSVSTKKIDGHIAIHVKVNGNGIPQNIVDNIFQPFFTTKPTGEGTGPGLITGV